MEQIRCDCKQCGHSLGTFVNSWTQIGKSYFSPILSPERGQQIRRRGDVRSGEKHSLVENCQLQDIACAACGSIIGLECVSTPVNHVLQEKQIFLRHTSVVPVSVAGNHHVDLVVKRYLQLRERTTTASSSRATPGRGHVGNPPSFVEDQDNASDDGKHLDISHIQADLDVQREDIDRIDSAGYQIVSAFDKAVLRIEHEMQGLQDSFKNLKQNMGENHDHLSSLKTEVIDIKKTAAGIKAVDSLSSLVTSLKTTVSSLRHDLDATSMHIRKDLIAVKSSVSRTKKEVDDISAVVSGCTSAAEIYANEVKSLRAELTALRKQLMHNRSGQSTTSTNTAASSREVDILASNIAKIGNRANQVETLQMEFDILKGRVERMEADYGNKPDLGVEETGSYPPNLYISGRRKRPSSAMDPPSGLSQTSELIKSDGKKTRLTKTGAVDKRTQRRTSRRGVTSLD